MLPLIYAAADAVVVCESRDFMGSAWVRLHLALAHAFAPSVRNAYLVDRKLIHVPHRVRFPLEPDRPPLVATATGAVLAGGLGDGEGDAGPGGEELMPFS